MQSSIQRMVSDGTLQFIDLAINYIDKVNVQVYVDDVPIGAPGSGTPYTYEWITDTRIKITPVVPLSGIVVLRRLTPTSKMYHVYDDGATFNDFTMDENFKQLLFIGQEAIDGGVATDFYSDINIHGYRIKASADGIEPTDLVTVRQYLQGVADALQYVVIGPYAAGLNFTARNQAFSYLGEFYAPGPAIALPYTTTGVGASEIANFRSVGDAVLRSDLTTLATPSKASGLIPYQHAVSYKPGSIGSAQGRVIPVESFRTPGLSDSNTIRTALDYIRSALGGKSATLLFESSRTYTIDSTASLSGLERVTLELNNCVLKRAAASTTRTTLAADSGTGQRFLTMASIPANWGVGDKLSAYSSAADANTSKNDCTILSINQITKVVELDIGLGVFGGFTSTIPAGTKVAKNYKMFSGGDSYTAGQIVNSVRITGGTFDGNVAQQENNSWYFGGEIQISGRNCSIDYCSFVNSSNECIVGHGVRVSNNEFLGLYGSCLHTSQHDNTLAIAGGSFFTDNRIKSVCLAGQAASGHSEGAVTFSWGAGNLIVANNNVDSCSEAFLGAFGPANEAENPDKILTVTGNIVKNCRGVMASATTPIVGVILTNNSFFNCGESAAVLHAICNDPLNQVSGNVFGDAVYGVTSGDQNPRSSRATVGGVTQKTGGAALVVGSGIPSEDLNRLGGDALFASPSVAVSYYCAPEGFISESFYSGAGFGKFIRSWNPASSTYKLLGNTAGASVAIQAARLKLDTATTWLPVYADNAAATSGGLAIGTVYRTGAGVLMVRF